MQFKRRRFVLGMAYSASALSLLASQWSRPASKHVALADIGGRNPRTTGEAQSSAFFSDTEGWREDFEPWATIDGVRFGAMPDGNGPIGGARGYRSIVTDGTTTARTYSEIRSALARAKKGDIVFVPGDASINLAARHPIKVPGGVVLASNRGRNGSKGALFWSDARETGHSIRLSGGSRLTGIRVRGPFHEPEASNTGENATRGVLARGNNVEVDNCEILDQLHAGLYLRQRASSGHDVHHNHIHHCWGEGLGYGVLMNGSSAHIHHNLFNANRHSTAHNGRYPSAYLVEENLCLELMVTHCFDMHSSPEERGPGPSGDGGGCAVIVCRNNTTKCVKHYCKDSTRAIIQVRGRPYATGSLVAQNWLWHPITWSVDQILRAPYGGVVFGRNLWAGPGKIVR